LTSVPAHELTTTQFCKVDGCTNESTANVGPYAKLCETHKFEARQMLSDAHRASAAERKAARTNGSGTAAQDVGSFEERAKGLVAVGRRLDRARRDYVKRRASIAPAEAEFKKAMELWKAELRRLAGD